MGACDGMRRQPSRFVPGFCGQPLAFSPVSANAAFKQFRCLGSRGFELCSDFPANLDYE
jgi:hypothetical protein